VNKILTLILFFLLLNNCSSNKNESLVIKKKTNLQITSGAKTILSKQVMGEQEFNSGVKIQISEGIFKKNSNNNQNDIGELGYPGFLDKIGKYNYKSFNDFEYIETKPIFYNDNIIFFDNKGTIIFYDKKIFIIKVKKNLNQG